MAASLCGWGIARHASASERACRHHSDASGFLRHHSSASRHPTHDSCTRRVHSLLTQPCAGAARRTAACVFCQHRVLVRRLLPAGAQGWVRPPPHACKAAIASARSDMKADSSNAQFQCPVCLSRCTWAPPCDKLCFSNLISCVCTPLSALPSAEACLGFRVCSLGPSWGAHGSWSVGSSAA